MKTPTRHLKLETWNSRRSRGFTLIVPKFAGRTEQARQAAAKTQVSSFATVLDAYEVDNGFYPKGKSGLNDLVQASRDAKNWRGPYLKEVPKDPWGNDYVYECPGKNNPTSYDVSSMGPDGQMGTEDDINNWSSNKR